MLVLLQTDFANRDARAAFFSRVEEDPSGQMHSLSALPPLFGPSKLILYIMYIFLHASVICCFSQASRH